MTEDVILTGRLPEKRLLEEALQSGESEMVAVYGRRRVGKTFLIRRVYEKHICFSFTGTQHAGTAEQLANFAGKLQEYSGKKQPVFSNWREALQALAKYLGGIRSSKKKVLFFDELPWIAGRKSGFLPALDYFWNSWCTLRGDIVLVICGSAASWMIRKIINHKGGLHNRVTRRIRLMPFTLAETEAYLQSRNIKPGRRHLMELYMVMGGIPHYLREVKRGRSAFQNIDDICFSKDGLLHSEFSNLYTALFDFPGNHLQVIRALAKKRSGLTRNDIMKAGRLSSGGTLSRTLNELIESGFISESIPPGKKLKDTLYRLTDEYTLFYLKFIEPGTLTATNWRSISAPASFAAWQGYAFENLCHKHIDGILKALGIHGMATRSYEWQRRSKNGGAQVDMVIERSDNCVHICEIKYGYEPFVITRSYAAVLQQKMDLYRRHEGGRRTLFLTMITAAGLHENMYSNGMTDNRLDADALFL